MNAFLGSMRASGTSFRAEAIRAGRELRVIESEFKGLKQRTDCLLRAIDMPSRGEGGRRELRVTEAAARPRRNVVDRSHVGADESVRRAREDTPVAVLPFRTERFTAFRARSHVFAHSARTGPEPIRFVPIAGSG